jgi:riboflavin biosynthesis pyrimidine reductase
MEGSDQRARQVVSASIANGGSVRLLYPESLGEVDPLEAYGRLAPLVSGRPAVRVNMIASLDGASSAGGLSGALGGPADRALLATLRSLADVILVGAGTARAEHYGPARLSDRARARRRALGLSEVPPIAVITRSCRLDWATPFFVAAEARPVVVTVAGAAESDRHQAAEVADVVLAGDHDVEMERVLAALAERGNGNVLMEGGPSLVGQLATAGLVDELCLTVSPTLLSGDAQRILTGPVLDPQTSLRLVTVFCDDAFVFLRYQRVDVMDDRRTNPIATE